MKNIINYKKFELFLEEVDTTISTQNSDKEVKLKDHQDKVNQYNSKKNSFKNILAKDQKTWEDAASKIIDGNVYLGKAWKFAKMTKQIDEYNEKIKSGDMSDDEVKEIQTKIKLIQTDLSKEQRELQQKIKEDLQDIKNN